MQERRPRRDGAGIIGPGLVSHVRSTGLAAMDFSVFPAVLFRNDQPTAELGDARAPFMVR